MNAVVLVEPEIATALKEAPAAAAAAAPRETTNTASQHPLLQQKEQEAAEEEEEEQQRQETTTTTTDEEAAAAAPPPPSAAKSPSSIRKRKSWHASFQQLVEYRARHGHTRPTLSGTPEPQQQHKQHDAAATAEDDNDTDNTSSSSSSKEYARLCNWVAQQRLRRRQNTLSAHRIAELNAIGFAWETDRPVRGAPADALWQRKYELVRRFCLLNGGHTVVPHDWKYNRPLADWVKKQRFLWHKKHVLNNNNNNNQPQQKGGGGSTTNALTDERIAKLNAINFVWKTQQSVAAVAATDAAAETKQKTETNTKKPRCKPETSHNNKKKKISGRYYQKLTSESWKKRLEQLRDFAQERGHLRVPEDHPVLGAWVRALREEHQQRLEHGDGGGGGGGNGDSKGNNSYKTISDEHYNEVDQMGFAWTLEDSDDDNADSDDEQGTTNNNNNSSDERWNQRFAELLTFQAIHGHCRVPQNYAPNKQLGLWVSVQRRDYRLTVREGQRPLTDLHKRRFEKLERAGFEWLVRTEREGKSRADLWMDKYRLLRAYHRQNGNCNVPARDELFNWVHKQKKYYRRHLADKANPLTVERIGLLQALDFPFPQRPEGAPRPPPQPGSKKRKRVTTKKKEENDDDTNKESQEPKRDDGEENSVAPPTKASASTKPKTSRNKRRRTPLPRTNKADATCAATAVL